MKYETLCLNSEFASFGRAFEGQITSQLRAKAVPIWGLLQMQPTNIPSFPFLEDAPLRSFLASHIPKFFSIFAHLKKKKEREKMATSHGVDQRFRQRIDRPI